MSRPADAAGEEVAEGAQAQTKSDNDDLTHWTHQGCILPTMTDAMPRYWVQGNDQKPYGPYDIAVIRQYIADGRLSLTNLATAEGSSNWIPIGALIGGASVTPASPLTASGDSAMSALIIWAWVLGPLSLGCGLLTGIPAIICAGIAIRQPAQKSRALPALIVAIICALLGSICGIIVALRQ